MANNRRRKAVVVALAVAVLAACSSPGSKSPAASPKIASFGVADVQRAVDELAKLGIETRIRPSDAGPISAVTGDRSPVRLLRHQVRNLALERVGGGGTRGADLDALSAAGGGGPVSALLAGWAVAGTTAGAKLAASLVSRDGPSDPAAKVFPTLALIAFLADVNAGSSETSTGGRPALLALASTDFCADVSAYLSDALDGIVNSTADPPAWLKQLIDLYAPQYNGDPELLHKTIGALALLSYATSLARTWTVSLVPDPQAVAYGIEGEDPVGGEVDLTVLSGADVFGDDVADCASLADAQLASVPVEGSSVVWDSSGLGAHATDVAGQSQVDDTGVAALTYQTATESKQDAENGDPVTVPMWVNGWVDRAEMTALAAVVKSILLGDAAGSPAGATVKALYQAMEPTLNTVMRPSGLRFHGRDVPHAERIAEPQREAQRRPKCRRVGISRGVHRSCPEPGQGNAWLIRDRYLPGAAEQLHPLPGVQLLPERRRVVLGPATRRPGHGDPRHAGPGRRWQAVSLRAAAARRSGHRLCGYAAPHRDRGLHDLGLQDGVSDG